MLMYAVQPLLPIFTEEFHISAAASSLALSLTTGCLAVSMLVIGALAEGWSRTPIMSVSLLAAALLTLLSSVAREWPAFLLILRSPVGRQQLGRHPRARGEGAGVAYGWNGVAAFLSVLLIVALGIAVTRLKTEAR